MKTENLTWAEAVKAYVNGERIRDVQGIQYWLEGDSPWIQCPSYSISARHEESELCPSRGPFSIVKPEPKRLTLEEAEEAYEAGKWLMITRPSGQSFIKRINSADFHIVLCYLDLACRKGWPITEVE